MAQRNSRAERLFAAAKQTDVPAWKAIKDAEDKRRDENTAKLRNAQNRSRGRRGRGTRGDSISPYPAYSA